MNAEAVIERVASWARGRPDVVGVLLVGSYARGAARPDSDVDLVVLVEDPVAYGGQWYAELGLGELVRNQAWGVITEWRLLTPSGLEVELGLGAPSWAATEPIDAGTRRVVTDGACVVHDPREVLARLLAAI